MVSAETRIEGCGPEPGGRGRNSLKVALRYPHLPRLKAAACAYRWTSCSWSGGCVLPVSGNAVEDPTGDLRNNKSASASCWDDELCSRICILVPTSKHADISVLAAIKSDTIFKAISVREKSLDGSGL